MPVSRSVARWIRRDRALLGETSVADRFLPRGSPPEVGDALVQSDLGSTLQTLAEDGPRALYEGELARRLCAAGEAATSPLRPSDFADYRAEWVDPVTGSYRGRTVYELPPNAQGFSALQIFALLDRYDVGSWGDGSVDHLHHAVEATKLAFADRDEWLADPAFVDVPLDRLLSGAYLDARQARIDPTTTGSSSRPSSRCTSTSGAASFRPGPACSARTEGRCSPSTPIPRTASNRPNAAFTR